MRHVCFLSLMFTLSLFSAQETDLTRPTSAECTQCLGDFLAALSVEPSKKTFSLRFRGVDTRAALLTVPISVLSTGKDRLRLVAYLKRLEDVTLEAQLSTESPANEVLQKYEWKNDRIIQITDRNSNKSSLRKELAGQIRELEAHIKVIGGNTVMIKEVLRMVKEGSTDFPAEEFRLHLVQHFSTATDLSDGHRNEINERIEMLAKTYSDLRQADPILPTGP